MEKLKKIQLEEVLYFINLLKKFKFKSPNIAHI